MAIVKKEEWTGKPMTKGYIFFGRKRPKNLEENLAAQQDPTLQSMIWEWYEEKDPELKKQKWQDAMAYWAVRRKELGFLDEGDIKRLEEEKRKREVDRRGRRRNASVPVVRLQ